MSFPITCSACGARLRLPPGCTKKKARCPRCDARMSLTAALDAVSYLPDSVPGGRDPAAAPSGPAEPRDDTLPHADPHAATRPAAVADPPFEREEDPLPYLDLNPTPRRKAADDSPAGDAPPPAATPFRTPARVTADSANLFAGPCEVVLVPHGLFLESVPYRPFAYAPLGSKAEPAGRRELAVTLPAGRVLTVEFAGPDAARIRHDAAAFLARERGLPDHREYRRAPNWLLGLAAVFALGLSVGPVVLSRTTELGVGTGLLIGAGFAAAGLLANAAVVLLTRLSVPGKVAVMTTVAAAVTGVFLFAATAYLAGREAGQPKPPPPPDPPPTKPPDPPPDPRRGLPTTTDLTYRDGFYRLRGGPDEVTALGVTPDGAALLVGYRNGATRSWRFDNIAEDEFGLGPRGDGPVTRIRFAATGSVAYLACDGGTVAAHWNDPPEVPLKIPGEPFAAHTSPTGERYAVYRLQSLVVRYPPADRLKGGKADPWDPKSFVTLHPKDEVQPPDVDGPLDPPAREPTFLAWHPPGRLLGGMPDGSVVAWGRTRPRSGSEVVCRDHTAPVRAWAAAAWTWDFATGDDKGAVGLWPDGAATPRAVFAGAAAAIKDMAFSPCGRYLALADADGRAWVWDLHDRRPVVKTVRPEPVRAVAFGPNDDVVILGTGSAVELWHLPELAKLP